MTLLGMKYPVIGPSQMQWALYYVSEWSKKNDMNLNKTKTKFMEIKFSLSVQAHPLILEGEIIDKVNTVKHSRRQIGLNEAPWHHTPP